MIERELLKTAKHMALATTNEDGSPHNTPLFYAIDFEMQKIYFASRKTSLHSQNIERTGQGFAVIYDSNEFTGGVYMKLENMGVVSDENIGQALSVYNKKCTDCDNDALAPDFHLVEDGYSLYEGNIASVQVYNMEVDDNDYLKNETRRNVVLGDLKDD